MAFLARGLRSVRYGCETVRSRLLVVWYRALYPNLRVGRDVWIGKGVHIHVQRFGSISIGDSTRIDAHAYLVAQGKLVIGPRSYVGVGTTIVAAEIVNIGADALIAAYVTIRDQDHSVEGVGRMASRPLTTSPVTIGENVWIATKATVLRGSTIGDDAVIGAHALVRSSIPPRTLAGGVPARVLKSLADGLPE